VGIRGVIVGRISNNKSGNQSHGRTNDGKQGFVGDGGCSDDRGPGTGESEDGSEGNGDEDEGSGDDQLKLESFFDHLKVADFVEVDAEDGGKDTGDDAEG